MRRRLTTMVTMWGLLFSLMACGGGGGPAIVLPPGPGGPAVFARFAFVPNLFDNTLSTYTIDGSDHSLRALSYAVVGASPTSVAVHPNQRFVYVTNRNDDNVSGFEIDSATGHLTELAGSPFGGFSEPISVVMHPGGSFGYVLNNDGAKLHRVDIDTGTGALTLTAPIVVGANPFVVHLHPSGNFAAVVSSTDGNVSILSITPGTGALAHVPGSPFAPASFDGPFVLAFDPLGRFAYVCSFLTPRISAFTIDAVTGAVAEIPGSPFALPPGTFASSAVVRPGGGALIVADGVGNELYVFEIDQVTGGIAGVPGSPFATGQFPQALHVSDDDAQLHVVCNDDNEVALHGIHATTHELSPEGSVRTQEEPVAIAVANGTAPVTYRPTRLYATTVSLGGTPGEILVFTVNPTTGALTQIPGSPFPGGGAPAQSVKDRRRDLLYVVTHDNFLGGGGDVYRYDLNPLDGSLLWAGLGVLSTGADIGTLVLEPAGRFAYLCHAANVRELEVDPLSGFLDPVGSVAITLATKTAALDPSHRFLYVGSNGNSAVAVPPELNGFRMDPVLGTLSFLAGSPYPHGALAPVRLVPHPNGRFLYTLNLPAGLAVLPCLSCAVNGHAIDEDTGVLTPVPGAPFGAGTGPASFSIHPKGRVAYLTTPAGLELYKVLPTGELDPTGNTFAAGTDAGSIVFSPSGLFAYVTTFTSIDLYAANFLTGELIFQASHPVSGVVSHINIDYEFD